METTEAKAYSIPDAARVLSISARGVQLLITTKKLKSFKTGRLRRISATALDAYIRNCERQGR